MKIKAMNRAILAALSSAAVAGTVVLAQVFAAGALEEIIVTSRGRE